MVRGRRRLAVALVVVGCLSTPARSAGAQDDHRLRWSDDWARVHPAAYPAMGLALGGAIVFDHLYELPPEPSLRGQALFDAPVRAHLRAPTEEARDRADRISDALLIVLLSWPAFDALGVAGIGDLSSDVAWQLTMVALEAVTADYVLRIFVKLLLDRERPFAPSCTPEERRLGLRECGRRGRGRSFYSAHSSAAFSSAGVVCMAHAHLPLYGSPAADWLACATAMLTASTVGLLRIVSDRHHATDVVAGALAGMATGLLLPYLLHYGWDLTADRPDGAGAVEPLSSPLPAFTWTGSF